LDTGNNFSLLEDPIETVTTLAPWALTVHLKDQAIQPCREGFLLGDIPLGKGFIDLTRIVDILKRARADIHFTLELLTRDPLLVPCLEARYWVTFKEVPAERLAATLRTVRDKQSAELQYPSKLQPSQQLLLEQQNVQQSLLYARDHLGV
jgi:sugar phosphate isomerase/epimerase